MKIRIIHLSDFHLESEKLSYQKENLVKALIKDLDSFIGENTIIAFTGDLIDKGGHNFSNKDRAFNSFEDNLITPILTKFKLSRNRFFIIPGNHDVNRLPDEKYSEMGLTQSLIDREQINQFIDENRTSGNGINRIKNFKKFEKTFYENETNKQLSFFDSNFIIQINSLNIGVACLNSSWRCYDDKDKGKLIIGENQIHSAVNFLHGCKIKIALSHHSLDWLLEVDKKVVKPMIEREFDILLSGHVHSVDGTHESGFSGSFFHSTSPSTIADHPKERGYTNGYCIIDLEPEVGICCEYRKYDERHIKFVLDTEAGNNEGKYEYRFSTSSQMREQETKIRVIEHIKNIHFPSLDEDLIIYGTDTKTSDLFS